MRFSYLQESVSATLWVCLFHLIRPLLHDPLWNIYQFRSQNWQQLHHTPICCPLMKTWGTLIFSFSLSFNSVWYSWLTKMSLSSTLTRWLCSVCTTFLHSSYRPLTALKLVVYTTTCPSSLDLCADEIGLCVTLIQLLLGHMLRITIYELNLGYHIHTNTA